MSGPAANDLDAADGDRLDGRVALVTGASRGIGAAVAEVLSVLGCRVAVGYVANRDRAAAIVARIQARGGEADLFGHDLARESEVAALRDAVLERFGRIDVLINNIGSIARPARWDELAGDELRRTIDTNLTSTIWAIQSIAPAMIERRWGRIVNVSSTYAFTGASEILAYTAAKAGVVAVTRAMARELGPDGITVNAVAPGNIDTDMLDGAAAGFREQVAERTPLRRLGRPLEVARGVGYLVTASFVTGHVLVVDGGHLLNM
jgi:3-oxoacyl-[acyl-carrier protein] reductase